MEKGCLLTDQSFQVMSAFENLVAHKGAHYLKASIFARHPFSMNMEKGPGDEVLRP
jgi:hypothetical protein